MANVLFSHDSQPISNINPLPVYLAGSGAITTSVSIESINTTDPIAVSGATTLNVSNTGVTSGNVLRTYQANSGSIHSNLTSLSSGSATQLNIPGNGLRKIIFTNIGFAAGTGDLSQSRAILGSNNLNASMFAAASGYPLGSGSSLTLDLYDPIVYGISASGGVRIVATSVI